VKAPISGRIGRSAVTVGAMVTAYQPVALAVVQQLDPIYVDVTQSSADLLRLRRGLASGQLKNTGSLRNVKLLLEDGTLYSREGQLQFRDVTVDPTTGSVVLRMVFPNPDYVLLPGMFVRATVEEGVNEQGILAPQQGVTRNRRGDAVALVVDNEGKVAQRMLVVDRAIGDRWLVTKGLAGGDQVIVDNLQRIRPGDPVKVVPFAPKAGPEGKAAEARPAAGKK
jgi:membrane fusion protein (multidrug efflux system)